MSDALEFWKIVTDPVKDPVESANVGDAVTVEQHFTNGNRVAWVKIVNRKWVNDRGEAQMEIRDPRPGETYAPPELVIVVGADQ